MYTWNRAINDFVYLKLRLTVGEDGAGEMAQSVRVSATKPDNLNSVLYGGRRKLNPSGCL